MSFLSSTGLHIGVLWILGTTYQAVQLRRAMIPEVSAKRLIMVPRASAPQPTHLIDPIVPAESAGSGGESRAPIARQAIPDRPTQRAEGDAPVPLTRQGKLFLFPVEVPQEPRKQVVVQADVPPDLKAKNKTAVPEMLLWQLPVASKPKPQVVAAHSPEPPLHERAAPQAAPQMTARNREQQAAEVLHSAPLPTEVPAIQLPVTNTTPIRLLDALRADRLPSSGRITNSAPMPIHVIAIPELQIPQAQMIILPAVNQASLPGVETGDRRSSGNSKAPGADNSTGNESGQLNTLEFRMGGRASGAAMGSGPLGDAGILAALTRIVKPKDGKFNVVVLGASNLDAYPEAANILSGKMVYSVYVRTGGRKEWILQYCLPKAAEQAVKVRGSAQPIDAPYPYVMYVPKSGQWSDSDYMIVHGFITEAGRFDKLSAIGDIGDSVKDMLLGALQRWEFRPAARDGEPSGVEIALIIPRQPQ